MMIAEYIALFITLIYSFIILLFAFGWMKLRSSEMTEEISKNPVSIIIACRNEEKNIPSLLQSLINQSYPKNKTGILIIDDHSSDGSISIIKKYSEKYEFIKLLKLPDNQSGKKDAINFGIINSNSDVIITIDADCIAGPDWLQAMMNYYITYRPKMLSGPVTFRNPKGIFPKLQNLEFLSLIGSGAGAIGINKPIMNNGSNLLFEKNLYENSNLMSEFASGDDIFLMLHAKSIDKKSIHFIKSKDAIVYTKPAQSVTEFFNQRIRWTSKSKAYRDFDIIFTAVIVTLINALLVLSAVCAITDIYFLKITLSVFLIKSLIDLIILIPVTCFFKQSRLLLFFPFVQLIYPLYIVTTVISGLTGKFVWKDRKY
ncbi:MAG: glycosyltransferase [Bacteroidales bacterium]|nr:glycosyltransferase [Bacteroidales bacterium]